QSRAIKLMPEGPPETPSVTQVLYAQGLGIADELVKDPQLPLLRDEKRGERRLRLNPERALWRDSSALYNLTDEMSRPAHACDWLAQFAGDILPEAKTYKLSLYGIATDKAKIHLWREEELPLPLRFLENTDLPKYLREELVRAEGGAKAINRALFTLANHLLNPRADEPQARVDVDRIRKYMQEFPTMRDYWSRLELHFHRLIQNLAEDVERASRTWKLAIRQEARAALEKTLNGLSASARTLKAASRAQVVLNVDLARLVGKEEGIASGAVRGKTAVPG
ncbi:MAG: type I-E CRISPR-associated protein Cse1/CasA, partial [Bacillota bacterium]